MFLKEQFGEVSEWSKVLDSKSSVRQRTVGSNPTLSAIKNYLNKIKSLSQQAFLMLATDSFLLDFYLEVTHKMLFEISANLASDMPSFFLNRSSFIPTIINLSGEIFSTISFIF